MGENPEKGQIMLEKKKTRQKITYPTRGVYQKTLICSEKDDILGIFIRLLLDLMCLFRLIRLVKAFEVFLKVFFFYINYVILISHKFKTSQVG